MVSTCAFLVDRYSDILCLQYCYIHCVGSPQRKTRRKECSIVRGNLGRSSGDYYRECYTEIRKTVNPTETCTILKKYCKTSRLGCLNCNKLI